MPKIFNEQLTLGQLISELKHVDPDFPVYFDFVSLRPKGVHSYRGFYEDLAIGYEANSDISARQLSHMLYSAMNQMFTGYKGGEYRMHENTALWVANHNESGGTIITGVAKYSWCVRLMTKHVEI